jgi:Zn-dependent oligopeptidase
MVLVTNNWRLWAVGMVTSIAIFVVVYFAVIQPSTNTANQAFKTGIQQSQQVINQARKQLDSSGASNAVSSQASQQLDKASKLTSCVASAGTDPSKLASCQSQYGG